MCPLTQVHGKHARLVLAFRGGGSFQKEFHD